MNNELNKDDVWLISALLISISVVLFVSVAL